MKAIRNQEDLKKILNKRRFLVSMQTPRYTKTDIEKIDNAIKNYAGKMKRKASNDKKY